MESLFQSLLTDLTPDVAVEQLEDLIAREKWGHHGLVTLTIMKLDGSKIKITVPKDQLTLGAIQKRIQHREVMGKSNKNDLNSTREYLNWKNNIKYGFGRVKLGRGGIWWRY